VIFVFRRQTLFPVECIDSMFWITELANPNRWKRLLSRCRPTPLALQDKLAGEHAVKHWWAVGTTHTLFSDGRIVAMIGPLTSASMLNMLSVNVPCLRRWKDAQSLHNLEAGLRYRKRCHYGWASGLGSSKNFP
jgi:hypothetical protein